MSFIPDSIGKLTNLTGYGVQFFIWFRFLLPSFIVSISAWTSWAPFRTVLDCWPTWPRATFNFFIWFQLPSVSLIGFLLTTTSWAAYRTQLASRRIWSGMAFNFSFDFDSYCSLSSLYLSNNKLSSIPDSITQLTNLTQYVFFVVCFQFSSLSLIGSISTITSWNRCRIQWAIWRNSKRKTLNSQILSNHCSFSFSLWLNDNFDLPEQFQQNLGSLFSSDHSAVQMLLSDISIYYRKRDAARRAALFIIASYGEGDLAVFNRDLIKLLAKEVWETREDPIWMEAEWIKCGTEILLEIKTNPVRAGERGQAKSSRRAGRSVLESSWAVVQVSRKRVSLSCSLSSLSLKL